MKNNLRLTVLLLPIMISACTAFHTPDPYLPDRSGIEVGQTITAKPGENIYSIAHHYNVSMRELIVLNNLKPPYEVRPGQSIDLPAGGASFAGNMPPPTPAPLAPVEKNVLAPIEPAAVTSQSLAPIAVAPTALAPASPAATTPTSLLAAPPPVAAAPVSASPQTMQSPVPMAAEPVKALNTPIATAKAAATTVTPEAATATAGATASAGTISLIWPVQGPVISTFGAKGGGTNNDGVNIAAPKGAPVVAAAPGTVVYAGNEMKGFGNLVLIRHQGDWVTAYAHLDRVLVKKDSIVGQGDMIGTVGKTGDAPTPQLHFEARQAGKAVNPSPLISAAQ